MLGNYQAIIFDFDGVVAETMMANFKSWEAILSNVDGANLIQEEYFSSEGLPAREVVKKFVSNDLPAEEVLEIKKAKEEYFLKNFQPDIYEEIPQAFKKIKEQGKKLAIVTGGSIERISKIKGVQPLLEITDCIVTAETTKRGKPYPDPFLRVTESLPLKVEECLVIENAPLGIKAAKSAGMDCFAIQTTLLADDLKQADKIFENHKELFKSLKLFGEQL